MRIIRRILTALLIIAALGVISALVLYYRTDSRQVLALVSNLTQTKYRISFAAEPVHFDWLKGIEFKNLVLKDSSNHTVLIQAKEGNLSYNPFALLNREIDVLSIHISGLDTDLNDLKSLLSHFSNSTKASISTNNNAFKLRLRSITANNITLQAGSIRIGIQGSADFPDTLSHPHFKAEISLADGQVQAEGFPEKINFNAKNINLSRITSSHTPLSIQTTRGIIVWEAGTYKITGKDFSGLFRNFALKTDNYKISYGTAGRILTGQADKVSLNSSSFKLDRFSLDLSRSVLVISASSIQAELSNLTASFPYPGSLTGSIELTYTRGLNLSGNLFLSNLNFRGIKIPDGSITILNNYAEGSASIKLPGLSGNSSFEKENLLDTSAVSVRLNAEQADIEQIISNFTTLSPGNKSSSTNATASIQFPVNFSVKINAVKWKQLNAEEAVVAGSFQDKKLIIKGFSCNFLLGRVEGKAVYSDGSVDGDASFQDGSLNELSTLLFTDEKKIYGNVETKIQFHSEAGSPRTYYADFTATAVDGQIKNFFLQNKLRQFLYGIPLDDVFFDRIALSGKLDYPLLNLNDVRFDSRDIQADLHGMVDLTKKEFDAGAEFSFDKDYLSPLPNIAQILTTGYENNGRLNFKIQASGTFSKPVFSIKK